MDDSPGRVVTREHLYQLQRLLPDLVPLLHDVVIDPLAAVQQGRLSTSRSLHQVINVENQLHVISSTHEYHLTIGGMMGVGSCPQQQQ